MLEASKRALPLLSVVEKVKLMPQQRGAPAFPLPALEAMGSRPSLLHFYPAFQAPLLQHTQNSHHAPVTESIKWVP